LRAVERSFAVLQCLSGSDLGRTLQEIAVEIGLAKSTSFRIVRAVESLGYVQRGDDLRYTLAPKLAQLAWRGRDAKNVKQMLRPVLAELVRTTGENVALHCVTDDDRVCMDVARSNAPLVGMYRPGEKIPLGLGAASMVLMAYMPPTELRRVLRAAAKAADCTVGEIRSILATTSQQGYAVSHGGGVRTLTGIAAPVFDAEGAVKYALAIVLPTTRASGHVMELADAVRSAATDASARLGGGPLPGSPQGHEQLPLERPQSRRRRGAHLAGDGQARFSWLPVPGCRRHTWFPERSELAAAGARAAWTLLSVNHCCMK
jgi:IclR family KDG regulon transcriptional repressor